MRCVAQDECCGYDPYARLYRSLRILYVCFVTDSGKWTDLSDSTLHDGERLEQWLSSGESNAVRIKYALLHRKLDGHGQCRQQPS